MPKLATPLTDIAIRNHKPKAKPYKVSDGKGLFLLVKPDGSKFWLFRYRFEGKENTLSFGRYPENSLEAVRNKVAEALKSLAKDISPSDERKADKAKIVNKHANTFEVWARKWWQHWHVDKSPRHADYVMRRLEADAFPFIGQRPIVDINASDITKLVKAVSNRGAVVIAKRILQSTARVFSYAIAHTEQSKVMINPAIQIKPSDIITPRKEVNYARLDIKELPELLRAVDGSRSAPITRLATKLMALTFVRTSELINARWSEFDFEAAQWRIPAERMKMETPHIVPLARQSIHILETLKTISGDCELVFPNQNNRTKPMSNNTILKALAIMGYKGKMTGHGFRGIASTALHEQGYDHMHIELQLAHQERDQTSAAYNHALYLKQRTTMMQAWADYLDELKAGAKVIPLKSA